TRNVFRGINKTGAERLGILRLEILITEDEDVRLRFEGAPIHRVVRELEAGDRRSKQFFKSRLKKSLSPGSPQSQLLIERLPADAKFGHGHISIVVTEFFVATGGAKFERMKTGNCILGAEDWNSSFGV